MFLVQILVSFIVGGLFIALQTLIAERVTSAWRGIVLTIPSTLALGLLFVGLTKSPLDASEAAMVAPAALGICYAFVMGSAMLSQRGLAASICGGLLPWIVGAAIILRWPPSTFGISLLHRTRKCRNCDHW